MSHTPGPWTLNASPGDAEGDFELYAKPIYGPLSSPFLNAPVLAVVVCNDDARLIAAAPELLAACEAALRYIDKWSGEVHLTEATFKSMCAAVKKAKGE
jgi:hypothetical protein